MTQPRPEEFIPPPECPVFEPSWEEFADPYTFINKIRPIAEKTGICKVRPPPDWQPPFACDVDRLHFTPRIQRLNELEAQTRVKLNFLDKIAKFWELQGCTLKIPHVERKILDLYQLNRLVAEEGGFDTVCRERRWTKIAMSMGFAPGKAVGSHLRAHYERVLYPYNLFQAGANLLAPELASKLMRSVGPPDVNKYTQKPSLNNNAKDQEYKPHDLAQRQSLQPAENCTPARRAKRMGAEGGCVKAESDEACVNRPNLRRRMGSFVAKPEPENTVVPVKQEPAEPRETTSETERAKWRNKKNTPAMNIECSKPQEAFGFEQAYRDYSLRSFGDMADSFKSDYFNMPVHMVPTELVEKEFWRLVSTIEEDVTVEYGADIASKEFGSGFPIRNGRFKVAPEDEARQCSPKERDYLSCGWNLNNLPVMDPSVLTHVTADICGMKLPWLYVGMCFSSFCWHIEDHWSYSINYLHWGEPKTWYGAPGYAAEQLEEVMKKLAPELFHSQPDLLHQLVTIMNPNTLMAHGVPMPLGRQCVDHYRMLHRYCVFSHDELICKMAAKANSLDVVLASAVQKDMAIMIREEKELRDQVRKLGVVHSQQVEYDLLPDEERQCAKCRTTCYLSTLTCPCSPGVLVCLHHIQDLCSCPVTEYTLQFTLDDLYPMMNAIRLRAESYNNWASHVTEILEAKLDRKKSLADFRALIQESEVKMFPDNDLLRHLRLVTQDAEKCASVAQQLLNGKRQTRSRSGGGKSQNQLTAEELKSFVRQLFNLPCSIRQAPLLKDLMNRVEDFQQHSEKVLAEEAPSAAEIQGLLDVSFELDVELLELPRLRERLAQARWLERVQQASAQPDSLSLDTMRRLIDQGVGLAPHPSVERAMARLQELLTVSEHWEDKARDLLKARPRHCVETLAAAVQEMEGIPAYLPNCLLLKDSVSRAEEWLQEAEALQLGGRIPVLDTLSDMVLRARAIPIQLNPLARLESLVSEVQAWKESASKTFVMKNSNYTLLEVLCPRCEVEAGAPKTKPKKAKEVVQCGKRKMVKLGSLSDVERALSESKDSASAMATLAEVRLKEMEALSSLRAANESKVLSMAEGAEPGVCVCQGAPSGPMLQCELCRDSFHRGCVPGPTDPRSSQAWLCPSCQRSERPPLDKILPLLASLQRLRVRLPEGDALRYVIERTVSWQFRVQQLSASWKLPLVQDRSRPTPAPHRWSAASNTTTNGKTMHCPRTASCSPQEWNGQSRTAFYIEQQCIPLQGLSSGLEELMVEGLLLQVSLPEVQQLHHILLNRLTNPPYTDDKHRQSSQGRSSLQNRDGTSSLKKEAVNNADRRAKRHLEREGWNGQRRDKAKKPQKKKAKLIKEKSRDCKQASASPSAQSLPLSPSSSLSNSLYTDLSHSEDSEEDIDLCPAEKCQRPEGDEVDWVQCDGSCNQWFHQVCVGVSAELAEKEDYICVTCIIKDGHLRK
ncbi:hypothetical protein JZ751_017433 [Albula glossodonta]|uniref:[histone H3]-trimethyl-L-lysine(4) demethylase n=1 Tax=Albula glossodonta TaxID=121402 RepID=A0A8T2PP06_9TELE|nr:hypothetical protein JZ751_017433 [Albula glossodonta]